MSDLVAKIGAVILVGIGTVGLLMILGLILAFPLEWTWNYVMPYEFGFKELTWGQAWCLSYIAGSLIKSTHTSTSKA